MKTIKDLKDWISETKLPDDTPITIEIDGMTGQEVPINEFAVSINPTALVLVPDMAEEIEG